MQRVHDGSRGRCLDLHQIDVLGIAGSRLQEEFVERGAASEGERLRQEGMGEDRHEGATDHQILLDLDVLHPGRALAPGGDVVARDQTSASTRSLIRSFQFVSRSASTESADDRSGA